MSLSKAIEKSIIQNEALKQAWEASKFRELLIRNLDDPDLTINPDDRTDFTSVRSYRANGPKCDLLIFRSYPWTRAKDEFELEISIDMAKDDDYSDVETVEIWFTVPKKILDNPKELFADWAKEVRASKFANRKINDFRNIETMMKRYGTEYLKAVKEAAKMQKEENA